MIQGRAPDGSPDVLMDVRERRDYNDAERWFSRILRQRLEDLLEAKRDRLEVLHRYPDHPNRLGVMATPVRLPRDQLRLPVAEELVCQALNFVRSDERSGPVSQSVAPDGSVCEVQTFPTKYPHIVIERTDRYAGDNNRPVEISWSLVRVQNQRRQTQVNRILDVAGLALDLLRVVV